MHNRASVTNTGVDPVGVGNYTLDDKSCEPADFQMNQYTATPAGSRAYDDNGNLIRIGLVGDADGDGDVDLDDYTIFKACFDGGMGAHAACPAVDADADGDVDPDDALYFFEVFGDTAGVNDPAATIQYNYRNEMVAYNDLKTGKRHEYVCDVFGRRIEKRVDVGGANETKTRFYYGGLSTWQVIEEREWDENDPGTGDDAWETRATYAYGGYIDEVVQMQLDSDADGLLDATYYYHEDDMYNVMAVTEDTGTGVDVVERYDYGDYGQPRIMNADGTDRGASAIANPYMFTGRRFDEETGWYYYRHRYMDPVAGRFTTRDPIGLWGDLVNSGSASSFAGSNAWTFLDPFGLKVDPNQREWHHKVPKKHRKFLEGIYDVDAPSNGKIMRVKDHRMRPYGSRMHTQWNKEWDTYIDRWKKINKKTGRKPTKEQIEKRLQSMERRFKKWLDLGENATENYKDWRNRRVPSLPKAKTVARAVGVAAAGLAVTQLGCTVSEAAGVWEEITSSPKYERFVEALEEGDSQRADTIAQLIGDHDVWTERANKMSVWATQLLLGIVEDARTKRAEAEAADDAADAQRAAGKSCKAEGET